MFGSSKYEKYKSFLNEIPEQGPFKYGDGSIYLGHMLNNKRYGRGKFLFKNGSLFEGYWKNDVKKYFYILIIVYKYKFHVKLNKNYNNCLFKLYLLGSFWLLQVY